MLIQNEGMTKKCIQLASYNKITKWGYKMVPSTFLGVVPEGLCVCVTKMASYSTEARMVPGSNVQVYRHNATVQQQQH